MTLTEEANEKIIGLWVKNSGDYAKIRDDFDNLDAIDFTSVEGLVKSFKLNNGYLTCMDEQFEKMVKRTQPDGWITENPFIFKWNKSADELMKSLMMDVEYDHNVCFLTKTLKSYPKAKPGGDVNLFGVQYNNVGEIEVYVIFHDEPYLLLTTVNRMEVVWFLKLMCNHVVIGERQTKLSEEAMNTAMMDSLWHFYLDREETKDIMVIPGYAGSWANTLIKTALKYPNDESKIRMVDTWTEVTEYINASTKKEEE